MPLGADETAEVLLEDASQFILDVCPTAADVSAQTRRRVVCAVVRRSMGASEDTGVESYQQTAGPYAATWKPTNPHGDFYLTKLEKQALGAGRQKAYGANITGADEPIDRHLPICSVHFGATYCTCGADIAGKPIFEGG